MERAAFKNWFPDVSARMGVQAVEFRRLDEICPMGPNLQVGNYSLSRNDIWVIEEWYDRFLPTPELIYYTFHELGHHTQWVRGEVPSGGFRKKPSPKKIRELDVDANHFASSMYHAITGEWWEPEEQLRKEVKLPLKTWAGIPVQNLSEGGT